MRGVSKKMFISILTSVIVFVTMVATTFAWVGIFTYANTETFNFNLKVTELDVNYYLTISASGEKNTFSDSVDLNDIRKNILKNNGKWTDDYIDSLDENLITSLYSRYSFLNPSTPVLNNKGNIESFKSINYDNTGFFQYVEPKNGFLSFDLYLSVDTKEGIQPETEVNSNIFITDLTNTLNGTIGKQHLTNGNNFNELPSFIDDYSILKNIPDYNYFNVNSANATRFALSMYEPIDINESYDGSEEPLKTIIYQGGTKLPSMDGDVFNLGGNLPEDYNTALQELLIIRPRYKDPLLSSDKVFYDEALEKAIEQGNNELELLEENSKIWDKPNNIDSFPYLGVHNGVQTKMKIKVFFWFEGWDADCLKGINEKTVTLNLTFTAGIEE